MPIYYITSLLTTITSICLGVFVYYKKPKSHLHQSLFRLNITVALWSFFLFLHYSSKTPQAALITLKLLHSAAVFIPACYLHFIINLLGLYKKRAVVLSYFLSTAFLAAGFTPYFILRVEPKLYFSFYATAGPLYFFWILAYFGIAGYGAYLLIKNYSLAPPAKKNQIKYVLVASVIGFIGGATIYPLFYNIRIAPAGEHIIFLYPVIFTIAVVKHKLLDLNVVIRHTLVYSVSVILITLVYLILVMTSEKLLRDIVGYQSLSITLIAAVGIALVFTPIKNRVQSIADRLYIGGAYQRFKKELLESDKQKALANLAAGMAHEIRNPLTAIKTFAEYLPNEYNNAAFRENFSSIVKSEVDKINLLVTRLLEFAKPSELKIAPTDIHELMDYNLNLLSQEMIKSNVGLRKNYTRESTIVNADPNKLRHAFFNILKNAIDAMKDAGGTLTVSTSLGKNGLKIDISDTGCGIKKKDLNRIFEPFYSAKENGTGLGLAVAQSIIAEHNASMSAKSSPGAGTTFTVLL